MSKATFLNVILVACVHLVVGDNGEDTGITIGFQPTVSIPNYTDCNGFQAPMEDFTIVTALLDLKREHWPHFKRRLDRYLNYAIPLLNLNIPLVAYIDEKVKPFIQHYRRGKEHLTYIKVVTIHDLEYYKDIERIREIMNSEDFKADNGLLKHPEGFSAEYNILMNSKIPMVYEAAQENYFKTKFFYWLDMGYGHGNEIYPKSCSWSPRNLMGNTKQVTFIELNKLELINSMFDLYKKRLPPFLNGGFFGGSKIAIREFYLLHKEIFEHLLKHNVVDDDQTIAVACYFMRPELFHLVYGFWYDAFTLFH